MWRKRQKSTLNLNHSVFDLELVHKSRVFDLLLFFAKEVGR